MTSSLAMGLKRDSKKKSATTPLRRLPPISCFPRPPTTGSRKREFRSFYPRKASPTEHVLRLQPCFSKKEIVALFLSSLCGAIVEREEQSEATKKERRRKTQAHNPVLSLRPLRVLIDSRVEQISKIPSSLCCLPSAFLSRVQRKVEPHIGFGCEILHFFFFFFFFCCYFSCLFDFFSSKSDMRRGKDCVTEYVTRACERVCARANARCSGFFSCEGNLFFARDFALSLYELFFFLPGCLGLQFCRQISKIGFLSLFSKIGFLSFFFQSEIWPKDGWKSGLCCFQRESRYAGTSMID